MPNYFLQIDETTIGDHPRLLATDRVYYLYEYTSGQNYTFGATNNMISNLKKKPSRQHFADYKYKSRAIQSCAQDLAATLNHEWLKIATLVPVPPSKAPDHADYDDRIAQICRAIPVGFPIDVREMIIQTASTAAAHETNTRPTLEGLLSIYRGIETLASPIPNQIAIVDDVLTAGTHFRAMHTLLSQKFPGVPIVGLFIARRIFPQNNPFANFDFNLP